MVKIFKLSFKYYMYLNCQKLVVKVIILSHMNTPLYTM